MNSEAGSDAADQKSERKKPSRLVRFVATITEKLREYCAKKKKETPQDKFSRRLANATVVIAVFTLVSVGVGALTYTAIKGQLDVMQGQLNEMKSTGRQTDALIAANQKLADAAVKQAQAAAASASAIQGQLDVMQRQLDQMKTAADAAKITAESTKQSADATIALERPYLFLNIIKLVQPKGPTDSAPYIDYSFINVGRVPGVLKLFYVECLILKELPSIPEFHQSKFKRADNAIGAGAAVGSNTTPLTLPKCDFSEPITDEMYNELKGGQKFIFFQALILYAGALDFSYSRMFGSRYDFSTSNFYDVGAIYNHEEQEKGAPRPPVPPRGTPQMKVIP